MRAPFAAFAVAAALVAAPAAASGCLSGGTPLVLPAVNDANGDRTCLPGFYCPNLDPKNESTFPVACPPTITCGVNRLLNTRCETDPTSPEIQSPFEPVVCPGGYYCPTPTQKIECPSGSYCVLGSSEPKKCNGLQMCPAGADRPRGAIGPTVLIIMTLLLVLAYQLYHRVFRPAKAPAEPAEAQTAEELANDGMDEMCEAFQRARGGRAPVRVDFEELKVTIPAGVSGDKEKVVLEGVSGSIKPGKVTAIMGPSGAGKTVLMTTLLQKLDPTWKMEGDLRVNGAPVTGTTFKHMLGFVPQDDVLHMELSVDANVYYSSEVRLPRTWTSDERSRLRDAVIRCMGVWEQRDQNIGAPGELGLGSGQRKRVNIAVELATAPLLMFLDEPTSGLDTTTSLELVTVLRQIAASAHITIAMVVHQPRVEIWDGLDELLILGVGGRTAYKGKQRDVQEYFEALGVEFDPTKNGADIVMDAIAARNEEFVQAWKTSAFAMTEHEETPALVPTNAFGEQETPRDDASIPRQFVLFMQRAFAKQLSTIVSLVIESVVIGLCGLVMGNGANDFTNFATFKAPYKVISPFPDSARLPQTHMYMLMSLGLAASVAGVAVFGRERLTYFREAQAGMNRGAYFLASVVAALPRIAFASLIFATFLEFMGRMPIPFWALFGPFFFSYWCTYGVAACVSVVASSRNAPVMASTMGYMLATFSGFIAFPNTLKKFFFGFYAAQVMQLEHSKNVELWADGGVDEDRGYNTGSHGESFGVMIAWGICIHIVAYIIMVSTNRALQR